MPPNDEWEPSAEMMDAVAHTLALYWPARRSSMCALGLPPEEMQAIRGAAREILFTMKRTTNNDYTSHD